MLVNKKHSFISYPPFFEVKLIILFPLSQADGMGPSRVIADVEKLGGDRQKNHIFCFPLLVFEILLCYYFSHSCFSHSGDQFE